MLCNIITEPLLVVEYCSFNQFTTVTMEPLTGLFITDDSVAAQPESPQISNLKGHLSFRFETQQQIEFNQR